MLLRKIINQFIAIDLQLILLFIPQPVITNVL